MTRLTGATVPPLLLSCRSLKIPQLYLLLSAFYSLNRHKQNKVSCLQPVSLRCKRLHLAELMEAITSCLLLTVNSPYFGRGLNLIHNWKWLLWSIWYAFVLPTSAMQALPEGCSLGICVFSPCHFSPPSLSLSPLMPFFDDNSHFSWDCSKFRFQPKCSFK